MAEKFRKSSGNIFADIGFSSAEVAELDHKSDLIDAIRESIEQRELTQQQAAELCETDQPTISKVLRGRMESVTIDRLMKWLEALGGHSTIRVQAYGAKARTA